MGGDACEGLRLCIPSLCFIATRLSRQVRSVLMPCILVVLTLSSGALQNRSYFQYTYLPFIWFSIGLSHLHSRGARGFCCIVAVLADSEQSPFFRNGNIGCDDLLSQAD